LARRQESFKPGAATLQSTAIAPHCSNAVGASVITAAAAFFNAAAVLHGLQDGI